MTPVARMKGEAVARVGDSHSRDAISQAGHRLVPGIAAVNPTEP